MDTYTSEKINVGYLSSEFQNHALCYLMVELPESHDRSNFNINMYNTGVNDINLNAASKPFRDKLKQESDAFITLTNPVRNSLIHISLFFN